jgi:hypothetical protein
VLTFPQFSLDHLIGEREQSIRRPPLQCGYGLSAGRRSKNQYFEIRRDKFRANGIQNARTPPRRLRRTTITTSGAAGHR